MRNALIYRNALPLDTMLLEYRLESVLGAGGFGMTYLGWDTNLEKHVAIKEYLPGELSIRALDGSVVPVNTESENNYKWGLERFIQEARTLAKFSHPNIVRVNRYFEANGTSYMVMDYEAGESLNQYLRRVAMPDEATLKKILMPILDGLQAVHEAGFLHRDIKPSNVFIRENGTPVLLDFGSARMASGQVSKSLTAVVSPGYAPLEQYSSDGNQGPWSDIYALSSVLYRVVAGENPDDAVKRIKSDRVAQVLAAARSRYSERFLKAIEWGMSIDEMMRPRNVAEWRELFSGRTPLSAFNRGAASVLVTGKQVSVTAPTVMASQTPVQARRQAAAGTPLSQRVSARAPAAKRGKWIWRGAFLLVTAIAIALLVKQHAVENTSLPQARASMQDQTLPSNAGSSAMPRFNAADNDRSGGLRRDEVARRYPNYTGRFDEIDINRDGEISRTELERFMQHEATSPEIRDAENAQHAAAKSAEALAQPEGARAAKIEVPPPRPEVARSVKIEVPPSTLSTAAGIDRVPRPGVIAERPRVAAIGVGNDARTALPEMREFEIADRDGNGFLSPDEIRGRFPYIEKNFSQVDTDHDGRISTGEFFQFRRKLQNAKFVQ